MNVFTPFHQIATRVVRKFQSLFGLMTLGARAIVLDKDNQILLVKHTYQSHWHLPGGGVKKGESLKAAVLREIREEVGVIPTEDPELFGIYFHTYLGVHDYPVIYIVKNYTVVKSSSPEIEKMEWFCFDKLPDKVNPGTKRRLTEYFQHIQPSEHW